MIRIHVDNIDLSLPIVPGETIEIDMIDADDYYPEHLHLVLDETDEVTETHYMAHIHIYPLNDDDTQFEGFSAQVMRLQDILIERPDLEDYVDVSVDDEPALNLPHLPLKTEMQLFRVKPAYLETDKVVGIRYLAYYEADYGAPINDDLLYSFQGITRDGRYYVSVMVPVGSRQWPSLQNSPEYRAYADMARQYIRETVRMLNRLDDEQYSPSPTDLDGLIDTIQIK